MFPNINSIVKGAIGIDISDFSIEAVALCKKKGHLAVESYARFRLSPDVVEDGRLISKERLKEALTKLIQNGQPKALSDYKKVFFSVPESKVFSKVFSLPKNLSGRGLSEAINHQAEEAIPEITENLIPSIKILSSNSDTRDIFYAAADRTVVNDFIDVFNSLGWEVVGIVPEAVSSFAGLSDKCKGKTTLLLDLGARTTIASIFDQHGIRDSINIKIAGNNITNALMQKLNMAYAASEEVKRQIGLIPDHNGEVMLVVQGQLQPLADELKKFIDYHESSGQRVEQVVLIGGLAQMKGLDKYFGDNLSRPTIIGEAFIDNHFIPDGMVSVKYINALGLARLTYQKLDIDFYSALSKDKKKTLKGENVEEVKNINKTEIEGNLSVSPKSSSSRMHLLILFVIIILGALLFIFRENFYQLFNKRQVNEPSLTTAESQEKQALDGPFTEDILVTNAKEVVSGRIIGENFEVELTKGLPKTTEPFSESQETLLAQLDQYVLNAVNNFYKKDGYYIIPKIMNYEIIETMPQVDKFVVGNSLSLKVKYRFLAFSKDKLKVLLQEQGHNLSVAGIDVLEYTVLNQSFDSNNSATFNIRVELK